MERDSLSRKGESLSRAGASELSPSTWRHIYGEIAPSARSLSKVEQGAAYGAVINSNSSGTAPWRRSWGDVAPLAGRSPVSPGETSCGIQSNGIDTAMRQESGLASGSKPDARALGASAAHTRSEKHSLPEGQGSQNGPAEGSSSVVPDWNQYISTQPIPVSNNPEQEQSLPATTPGQDQIIAESLKSKTSVAGYLYTSALSGGLFNALSYFGDHQLMRTSPENYNPWQQRWAQVSPAMKVLNSYAADLDSARQAFACADTKLGLAKSELNALRHVPEKMLTVAQVNLSMTKSNAAESLQHAIAQAEFLSRLTEDTSPGEIRAAIGSRSKLGTNGIIFDHSSALGKRMRYYAGSIENGCFPRDSFITETSALQRKISMLSVAASEHARFKAEVQFFLDGKAGSSNAVSEATGTATEIYANTKLFLAGASDTERLLHYATKSGAHAQATESFMCARELLSDKYQVLKTARETGPSIAHGSIPSTLAKGFGKGLGIGAGSLALGFGVDTLIGQSFNYVPKQDGLLRYTLDGVIIPGVVLSSLPTRIKLPAVIGLFGGARVGDSLCGGGSSVELSTAMRPNVIDATVAPLIALAPLSLPHKLGGLAAEFVTGRTYNLMVGATGWDGNNGVRLNDQVAALRNKDAITGSERSFMDAVDKTAELAMESPAVVEQLLLRQYDRTTLHPLEQERELALLSYGLGLARLKKGSRLSATDYSETSYFLRGTAYDFGGLAAEQINSALSALDKARTYAVEHRGETVSGQVLDNDFTGRIDRLREKVKSTLDKIYGEQKIAPVYAAIREKCRTNMEQVVSFIKEKQAALRSLGPDLSDCDRRYVAKIARDLAIANLAYAEYCLSKNNGEDARTFFTVAEQHLSNSQNLENSPNSRQLGELLDRFRSKIPGSVKQQWQNDVNNPFKLRS
ncbi:MAG: hypothetical protein K2W95_18970 [Candidatus Obscuribacterales bacterium]|nr:hypothetical protein [Candidatus Obscuribacterales bacterium]